MYLYNVHVLITNLHLKLSYCSLQSKTYSRLLGFTFTVPGITMNQKSVLQYSGQLLRLEDCCQSIETSICDFIGPSVAPVNDPVQQPAGVGVKVQQQHHCLLGQLVDLSIKSTGALNSQTKLTYLSMTSLVLSLCC